MQIGERVRFDLIWIDQRERGLPRAQITPHGGIGDPLNAIMIDVGQETVLRVIAHANGERWNFSLADEDPRRANHSVEILAVAADILPPAEALARASAAFVAKIAHKSLEEDTPKVNALSVDQRRRVFITIDEAWHHRFPAALWIVGGEGEQPTLDAVWYLAGMVPAGQQRRTDWSEILRLGRELHDVCVRFAERVAGATRTAAGQG